MATVSFQFVELLDGEFVGRRTHYDGYPEKVGRQLLKDFNSLEDAEDLAFTGEGPSLYERYSDARRPVKVMGFKKLVEFAKKHGCYVYVFRDGWQILKVDERGRVRIWKLEEVVN